MSFYDLEATVVNNSSVSTLGTTSAKKSKSFFGSNNNITTTVILVIIWYSSALISVTSSKQIMNRCRLPFLLCSVQFICAACITKLYLYLSKSNTAAAVSKPLSQQVQSILFQISASYTFGFVLTNCAFSIVSTSFAETVKSAEPISTTLIGLLFFKERNATLTYLTLLPICFGVGISCFHSDNFNLTGFLLAAGSNVCFSTRAVLAKKKSILYPEAIDEIQMFAFISLKGLYFLLPLTFLLEGLVVGKNSLAIVRRSVFKNLGFDNELGNLSAGDPTGDFISAAYRTESWWVLYALVLLNGTMFACYNLVSYVVLRKTDLVTHAVLNVFRRVVIILFTAYFFHSELSVLNMCGVLTAVVGVLFFGYFRSMEKTKSDN